MPALSTHPSRDDLSAYNLGQLSEEVAAVIDDHINECRTCCETLIGLSADDTFVDLLQQARQLPAEEQRASESDSSSEVPSKLAEHPRYEIRGLIGKGGMGHVYHARHRMMNRTVALKVIKHEFVRKPEAIERFHREVTTAAQLSHPNVVAAYDAEQAGDDHFMVMEYVDGVDLHRTIDERGPLSIDEACDYIRQAAIGLQYAHEQGMVHRDIKPHNLMVTSEGVVKILDFGLASLAPTPIADDDTTELRSDLTAVGTVMGTPDFISPEQAQDARQADIRSDIYSLGATFYYLLSGRPPFDDGSVMHKLKSHAQVNPDSLSSIRDDVPDELVAIVSKMMAKDPEERYLTPSEVAEALEEFLKTWRPEESKSGSHQSSNGGGNSGSEGKKAGADATNPSRYSNWPTWLYYASFVPIAIMILDVFFLSPETSVAAVDRSMFYVAAAVILSTIAGIARAVENLKSGTINSKENSIFHWTASEKLLMGFILGAAAVVYYIQTHNGIIRVEVNDPSIQVSVQNHLITMKDGNKQPLKIRPGENMLLVSQPGANFRFHTDSFQIRRGGEIAFKVELLDGEIVVHKDGEPFDRTRVIDVPRELEAASELLRKEETSKPESSLKLAVRTSEQKGTGRTDYKWKFDGEHVGELKVKLLLAENGETTTAREVTFRTDKAKSSIEVQLNFLNKSLGKGRNEVDPQLQVSSEGLKKVADNEKDGIFPATIEGVFGNRMQRSFTEPIPSNETEWLYSHGFWSGDLQHGTDMPGMLKATRKGATFVFLTLEWKPIGDPGLANLPGSQRQNIDMIADRPVGEVQSAIRSYYVDKYPLFAASVNQRTNLLSDLPKLRDKEWLRQIGELETGSPVAEIINSFPGQPYVTFLEATELSTTMVLATKVNLYKTGDDSCRIVVTHKPRARNGNETVAKSNPITENELRKLVSDIKPAEVEKIDLPKQAIDPETTDLLWVDLKSITSERIDQSLRSLLTAAPAEKKEHAREQINAYSQQARSKFAVLEKGVEAGLELILVGGRTNPSLVASEIDDATENSEELGSEVTESHQSEKDQLFLRMRQGTIPKDAIAIMVETLLSEADFALDSMEAQEALADLQALEFVDIGDGWFAATGEGMLPLPRKEQSLDATLLRNALEKHRGASIRYVWLLNDDNRFEMDMAQLEAGAMFFGGLMTSLREMVSTSGGLWLGEQPRVKFEMQFANEDDAQQFKTSLDRLVGFLGMLITFGSDESEDPEQAQKMKQTRAALSLLFLNRDGANVSKTIDIGLLQQMAAEGLPWTTLLKSDDSEESEELPQVKVRQDAEELTAKRVRIEGIFKVIDDKFCGRRYVVSTKQEDVASSPNQTIDLDDKHVFEMSFDDDEIINVGMFHNKRVIVTGSIYYFPGDGTEKAETVFMLDGIEECEEDLDFDESSKTTSVTPLRRVSEDSENLQSRGHIIG